MSKTLTQLSAGLPVRSLTSWTVEVLRQAIIEGNLRPGERLDQDALAAELGVSRTPLREAIAALESEGLLESKVYRGVFVTEVSKEDILEVFALRALLEVEVVRQAVLAIPTSVLDQLETALGEAQRAYEEGDQAAQFEADVYFHTTLREFSDNSLLKEVLGGLANRISAVRRFGQTRPGPHVNEFAQEHRAILQALKERDIDLSCDLMKAHLDSSADRVVRLLDESREHSAADEAIEALS
jgi:DNA-binding GntR family transcriptional regulator